MIFEKVREVIVNQLGVNEEKVTMKTTFEELGADSLDLFQIVIDLEEIFNIRIEETDDIKAVEDAVNFIQEKI